MIVRGGVDDVGEDEEDGRDDPDRLLRLEGADEEPERHDAEEEVQIAAGGRRVDLDAVVLLAAVLENHRRRRDEQHRDRAEQKGRADDGPDRDLDRLRVAGVADQRDDRDHRLGERGPDRREHRPDGTRAEVQPVPEPLDGVREAHRAPHDQHERGEQLEGDDHPL
ncbi:MAG TPA: hypothetical protein VHJ39_16695 [Solirubrobacteraceae bacterium]|nr:hypothetical protein [Solirubrobacteraceae bacterium]